MKTTQDERVLDIALESLSHIWSRYPELIPFDDDLFSIILDKLKTGKLANTGAMVVSTFTQMLGQVPSEILGQMNSMLTPFLSIKSTKNLKYSLVKL